MSELEIATFAALTVAGFALTALYAGLETGLYTLNRVRLAVRAGRGETAAVRLRGDLQRSGRTLTVLLIGTNAASYLGTYGLARLLHGTGLRDWTLIVVEALLTTPALFVLAETLPKDLFRTHTDRWTYWLTPFITGSRRLMTWTGALPLVEALTAGIDRFVPASDAAPTTARQRISGLIKEGVGAGVLSVSQAALTDRALGLRDWELARVMVPWSAVVSIPLDADRADREGLFRAAAFSRVPAVDRTGRAGGILSWVEVAINPEAPTAALLRGHLAFTPGTRLLEALAVMREHRQSMAIVEAPASRRPLGLVTLKDLVEPLTGELPAW